MGFNSGFKGLKRLEIDALPQLQVFEVQTLLFALTEFSFSSARLK
jgi:hypothetical protein